MNMIDDGGPVYPEAHVHPREENGRIKHPGWHGKPGISLRDYLAVHAPEMPVWFEAKSNPRTYYDNFIVDGVTERRLMTSKDMEPDMDHMCRWRYAYADAMIKQRGVHDEIQSYL